MLKSKHAKILVSSSGTVSIAAMSCIVRLLIHPQAVSVGWLECISTSAELTEWLSLAIIVSGVVGSFI